LSIAVRISFTVLMIEDYKINDCEARSPWRLLPNPLGLHPVTVREIDGTRVEIGPIEAFDGAPVKLVHL
jgi:hypothetical protein